MIPKGTSICILSAVLQENDNSQNSGFNLVLFDLENNKYKSSVCKWKSDSYSNDLLYAEWKAIDEEIISHSRQFSLSDVQVKWINDLGVKLTHVNKSEINLEDVFIHPNLRQVKITQNKNKILHQEITGSESLGTPFKEKKRIILTGQENSGKTTLCKELFIKLYNSSFFWLLFMVVILKVLKKRILEN